MGNGILLSALLLGIGIYVLVAAIRGKGKLYQSENIKDKYMEKFPHIMRAIYYVLAIVMLVSGLASLGQSALFEQTSYYGLSENYTAPDGTAYTTDQEFSYDEMTALINADTYTAEGSSSGSSLCSSSSSTQSKVPYISTAVRTEYSIKSESFAFLCKDGEAKNGYDLLGTISQIALYVSLAFIILLFVSVSVMTDKNKKAKNAAAAAGNGNDGHVLPSSAFDFEEKTEDKK